MSETASCFYFGEVVHQRFAPQRHRLRYRAFQGLFDLDELPTLNQRLRFFSHNRPNLFAFHDSDHGEAACGSLREYVEKILAQAELSVQGGRIALLCMPRILGFVFNPLSIYYCYNAQNHPLAIICEVNNTFGQRHSYVIRVRSNSKSVIRQKFAKNFYVSPFMDMEMTYNFYLGLPEDRLRTSIGGRDSAGCPLIFASFAGVRRGLSDRMLLSALVAYPLLTLGVVVAIHWEAVKLFAKGLRVRQRPAPPTAAVTVVSSPATTPARAAQLELVDHFHKFDKQSA